MLAGFLVADTALKMFGQLCQAIHQYTTGFLVKPGPSQGQKLPFKHPEKMFLKPVLSSLSNAASQNQ